MAAVLLFFPWPAFCEEPENIAASLANIDRYTKGLRLGAGYEDTVRLFGQPRQKTPMTAGGAAFIAMWDMDGYSVDASFDKADRVTSYGVHWFGVEPDVPAFSGLLTGYEEREKMGTKIASIEGEKIRISWSRKPAPGIPGKIVSVLGVGKKTDFKTKMIKTH